MENKQMVDLSKFMITTRLLTQEALAKGYRIEAIPGRPSSKSYTVRCEKDGRELYYGSLYTALSPSYAVLAADDKVRTLNLLKRAGIKMPETAVLVVDDTDSIKPNAESLDLLKRYGSLAVKPIMTNHGDGVTTNVRNRVELEKAVKLAIKADEKSPDVLVQQMVFGHEYRFLVLHNKVLAVAYRRPPFVIGDGVSTIRELILQKNTDPRRGEGHESELTKIPIDEVEFSNRSGFLDVVPEKGSEVEVLKTSNLSRGGESIDVTDEVSSEIKEVAVKAAHACSLGIAGVDIVTDDIAGNSPNTYVLEVNASPGIRMHQFPSIGKPRNVAKVLFQAIEKTAQPIGKKMKMIGRVEKIKIPNFVDEMFKARIDTGATVSSIWASEIRTDDNGLHFKLFGPGSRLYTGEELHFSEYSMRPVRSSNGSEELRYQVEMAIVLKGRRLRAKITLADRSSQIYPMLVGRNILRNKFVVDAAKGKIDRKAEKELARRRNER